MARTPALPPERILSLIRQAGSAMGLEQLQAALPDVPRRTLQRRVARLVEEGLLVAEGQARARKYQVARDAAGKAATLESEAAIPLSPQGEAIRADVRRPLQRRRPVAYDPAFLEGYQPNLSFFLPRSLRTHLHSLGRSPVAGLPAGTYARQVFDRLLIDLSWASSRLEGNTYSRLDTQNLVQFGQFASGKDRLEAQMILNHKAAIEMLVEQAGEIGFNRYSIQNLHALLSENLLPEPAAGGRLRRTFPQRIEEQFDIFLAKARAIEDPFEQAFFAMVQLPYLQPFEDVNKRTSRLAANIPFIRHNLAPLSFVDVPQDLYVEGVLGIYELHRVHLLRDVFAWAYERSCQRYTALRDALPTPDPLRMRHREVVRQAVRDIIGEGIGRNDQVAIRRIASQLVDPGDVEEVVALIQNELHQLHEGNLARYRLRPSEYRAWMELQA